jgi:hypothetical protein
MFNVEKFLLRAIWKIAYLFCAQAMNPKRHSESLGNCGINVVSFSANGFVFSKSVRRSPDLETAPPNFRAVPPISKATAAFLKTVPPVSADAPPNLKAAPPIFGEFPRFCQPFPRFFGRRKLFGNVLPADIYTVFNPKLTKN